jgi:hypothetical protein
VEALRESPLRPGHSEKLNRRTLEGREKELGVKQTLDADEGEQPGFGTTVSGEVLRSAEACSASTGKVGDGTGSAALRYSTLIFVYRLAYLLHKQRRC